MTLVVRRDVLPVFNDRPGHAKLSDGLAITRHGVEHLALAATIVVGPKQAGISPTADDARAFGDAGVFDPSDK